MAYNPKKIAGGVAGGALLMFGAVGGIGATAGLPQTADADPIATTHAVGDNVVTAQWFNEDDVSYVSVANAQGTFTFNQEGVTPNDELFNVFGTALTSMCSKPATELVDVEGGVANFYVNVGGNIKKNFTIDVRDLAEDANQETMMACSCATGSPFGQAAVMGVPLSAVVEMADLEDGVNTVTAYGADGFGQRCPLRYAPGEERALVYQVNGQELEAATGSSLQLWMPETVARYFTRDIVNIELTQEDAEPDVQQVDPCYRNKINIMELLRRLRVQGRRRDHVRRRGRRSGKPHRRHRVLIRQRPHVDVVRHRRRHGRQVGELAVHHVVRGKGRLPHDRARENRRRHGVPACGDSAVRSGLNPSQHATSSQPKTPVRESGRAVFTLRPAPSRASMRANGSTQCVKRTSALTRWNPDVSNPT